MKVYDETTDRIYAGRIALMGVLVVLAASLIGALVWGIGVATSGIHGRGEQIKQINRADNRTFAQEQFQQLYNDVKTYDTQITTAQTQADAFRKANEGKKDNAIGSIAQEQSRLDAVVTGLKNQCVSTRNNYTAEAQKVSKERFRDADLPWELTDADTATDCKGASL
jgi:hypothetical protein